MMRHGRASICLSVRPSVRSIYQQQQRPPAGLLLSAPRAGDNDRYHAPAAPALSSNGTRALQHGAAARRSAANAGSVTLTTDVGG